MHPCEIFGNDGIPEQMFPNGYVVDIVRDDCFHVQLLKNFSKVGKLFMRNK
jgi:hypothetical protein